jgi:hypothetical protein
VAEFALDLGTFAEPASIGAGLVPAAIWPDSFRPDGSAQPVNTVITAKNACFAIRAEKFVICLELCDSLCLISMGATSATDGRSSD